MMNLYGPLVMRISPHEMTCHWRCVYCSRGYLNVSYLPPRVPRCLCTGGMGTPMLLVDASGIFRQVAFDCDGYALCIVPAPELTA